MSLKECASDPASETNGQSSPRDVVELGGGIITRRGELYKKSKVDQFSLRLFDGKAIIGKTPEQIVEESTNRNGV